LINKFDIGSFLEQAYLDLVLAYLQNAYKSVEIEKVKAILNQTDD